MSTSELYTKDTRVWIPDPDRVWKAARLVENYEPTKAANVLRMVTEDDDTQQVIDYDISSSNKLPPLRNPDILIGQNDLTALSYLNEPEVLYNLEVRFLNNNQIYTYCGIVLVAINPYEQLPIYGNEFIQAYNGQDVQNMDPHIFAVSEEAFQKMVNYEQNQSIIVSGESGAGKTVSAKYTMRYFANVGGSSEETQVEKKVLASNPIMEAFGNAKTTRNDNSSRFGKFIQIDFNRSHHIVGASMKTYLLEKSRVVFQAQHERNYHIFYQLCSQHDNKDYAYLKLGPANEFVYTNQGQAEQIDNVNDSDIFRETLDAFKLLDINKTQQTHIFSLISAIMHLGNVKINQEKANESSSVAAKDESIRIMCDLLKIDETLMRSWLCNKRIKTVNEIVNTPLMLSQALFSRDALAKHMYSQLFNWIVHQINKCLRSTVKTHSFIGVLDIYGFETFEINSFEQFCINYANEKLQQQFCQHVFKLEQEEYLREQIKWSFIEFYDNQPCIELIEGKLGILDLLDEECKMPKGSDATWCSKLYDKHLKSAATTAASNIATANIGPNNQVLTNNQPMANNGGTPQNHFSKPRMSQKAFIIHHFAENVEYQVDGFLEKNRDTVLEEQLKILKASEIDFIADLFFEESDEPSARSRGYDVKKNTMPAPSKTQTIRKKTVGSQFRESLNSLMVALNSTTPHYVRCIKPNDLKAPFRFEPKRAVEQLRACGVLETVRISAAGYPSRWTYAEFFQRYRMLVNSHLINRKQLKETCEKILLTLIKDQTKYQFGKTKIFFQAGQVAYLEKLRSEKLKSCGIMIQKHIRGWLARSKYVKMQKSTLLIQTHARGLLARRLLKYKRETRAAIKIQSCWKMYRERKNYATIRTNFVRLQTLCRGYLARKNRRLIIQNFKATIIQAHVRGYLARKRFRKVIHGITLLQAHVRRRQARKIFKTLKIEARSVEHQRQLNKGLENKIISLQQQIERINKERDHLSVKVAELEPLKAQVSSMKQNSNLIKESNSKIGELTDELGALKLEYAKVKKERDQLLKTNEQMEKSLKESGTKLNSENSTLQDQLSEANKKILSLQTKLDEMKCQLGELENERANHQKLVKEHNKLEQRFEKVRNELLKYSKAHQNNLAANGGGGGSLASGSLSSSATSFSHHAELESLIEELEQDSKGSSAVTSSTTASSSASSSLSRSSGVHSMQSDSNVISSSSSSSAADLSNTKHLNGSEIDLSLISKLQRRINYLESERNTTNERSRSYAAGAVTDHDNNNNTNGETSTTNSNNQQNHQSPAALIEKLQYEKDYEALRSQELDLENQKLRDDLSRLRELVLDNQTAKSESLINKEMMNQLDALNDELTRRREECIQMKTLLVTRHRTNNNNNCSTKFNGGAHEQSIGSETEPDNTDINSLNTDGNEYEVGYNTQKILNRILENQMTDMKRNYDIEKQQLLKELTKLREDNERQHALLLKDLAPDSLAEATFKNEIYKLTEGNLELTEKCERYADEIRKYKKMLKVYIRRSKTSNMSFHGTLNSSSVTSMNAFGGGGSSSNGGQMNSTIMNDSFNNANNTMVNNGGGGKIGCFNLNGTLNGGGSNGSPYTSVQIKSKNTGDYLGLLEWKTEDESKLISKLIEELKPRLAVTFLPGLPAYILFMCIRYADMLNDDDRVRSLLNSSVQSVKRLIKKKQEDLEYVVLWMTNFCRLIHNLKQYSGETSFQFQNTIKQNEHCLKNFDLTEYRGILSDIAIWLYQGIIKDFEKKLIPLIVSAMLEHDSLQGMTDSKLANTRSNSSANNSPNTSGNDLNKNGGGGVNERYTIESLIKKLNEFLNILNSHGVDPEIVNQIFKQLFYFIGANTFNNLVLRKEMCNWSKGMQLRYNINSLEQWIRDSNLQSSGAAETLEPIIQASQLLQARKSDSDIKSICEMCSKLTIAQIQRILFLYTPLEAYEEKLSRQFVDKVTSALKELRRLESNTVQQTLVLDTQRQFPVCIPFNPSNIGLETIDIPDQLGLSFLKKI